jgi:hypothetical protein
LEFPFRLWTLHWSGFNLPRYIDTTEPEDIQDIDGHLRGGIPDRDLDALDRYWQLMPIATWPGAGFHVAAL